MISVTILTKNCQETLPETLRSLSSFSEVILLDTGSTDHTLQIAQQFPNVKIHQKPFKGFGPTHNEASALASFDWILSIDSDEVLSNALIEEIHQLTLEQQCVYSIQRDNYYNGKQIKWCGGWYPDPVVRLYHRQATRFTNDAVHEKVIKEGLLEVSLRHSMRHTPYRRIDDFLNKMQTYTSLFAEDSQRKKNPSFFKALFHAWFAFFKSYILKRGFLGGKEGFIISAYNSHTTFYKYLKLAEKAPSE